MLTRGDRIEAAIRRACDIAINAGAAATVVLLVVKLALWVFA